MASPSLNSVLSTLKACVISNPIGVDEDRLNSEFRQLMGCNIPWRELGFQTLQQLVKKSPSLRVVTKEGRRVVIADTGGSEHLSAMIAKQKKTSSRKRTSRLNKYFHNRIVNLHPPSNFRGSGTAKGFQPSNNRVLPSTQRTDFYEKNNNNPNKPLIEKEVYHYSNSRSTGGRSSSHTIIPPSKPQSKSIPIAHQSKKQPETQHSQNQVNIKPIKPSILSTSKSLEAKEHKANTEKIIEGTKHKKIVFKDLPKESKMNISPFNPTSSPFTTSMSPISNAMPTVEPMYVSDLRTNTNLFTHGPQRKIRGVPDLYPNDPVLTVTPLSLPNSFIPDNLVPPKPMKSGSYRGSKRKINSSNKLMSIKDESIPAEGSISAKFIQLVKAQDWPDPEYRILPRTDADNIKVYSCTVKGSYSLDNNETLLTYDYSTIPDEYRDMNASKEAVSLKAFDDMSNKIKDVSDYIPITSDFNLIIDRVIRIVADHPNGMWAYKIQTDYKDVYGERLPSKWVDIVSTSGVLRAEKLADFSYVISLVTQCDNIFTVNKRMSLSALQYPETENWEIFITKVISSKEIWFRFVGSIYSDSLDELLKQMCEHYEDWSKYVTPVPVIGEVYVYPSSYGAFRVQVLSQDSPTHATVIYIDHGDIEQVPLSQLCILDYDFRKLPPQAIKCRMYDLDEYAGNKLCTAFLIDKLEGMVLVAEITQSEPLELIMYDTSVEEPINLNQLVFKAVTANITDPPILPEGEAVEGVVTSIWKSGEIYLQLPNDGLKHLELFLSSMPDIPRDHYLVYPEEVLPDALFLVQLDNGAWLRASLLPPPDLLNNMVDLLLIDTGDIITACFYDLVPLHLISMVLCEIPRQAIKVKLSDVRINDLTVEKLQSLLPPPCHTVIKLKSRSHSGTSEVELFIREPKGFMSINSTLQLEDNLSKRLLNISFEPPDSDYLTIEPAPIPHYGEFLDVFIVSVSNPTNFIVIPLKYVSELRKFQERLQHFYNNRDDPKKQKLKNFSIGQACSVQHSDGQWYRGLIDKIIDRSMSQLMIRFCDFGNLAMISAERLYKLDKSFQSLPALGFRASIADVQPVSGDWEIKDCDHFQQLMLEKKLVAVIKDKINDKGEILLKLQLFDTSGDLDCDIGDLLVRESKAIYSN